MTSSKRQTDHNYSVIGKFDPMPTMDDLDEGDLVYHPLHGEGHIVSRDRKKGTVKVQFHGVGGLKNA